MLVRLCGIEHVANKNNEKQGTTLQVPAILLWS